MKVQYIKIHVINQLLKEGKQTGIFIFNKYFQFIGVMYL